METAFAAAVPQLDQGTEGVGLMDPGKNRRNVLLAAALGVVALLVMLISVGSRTGIFQGR